MKRIGLVVLFVAALVNPASGGPLSVVATTTDLAAIAKAVGDVRVDVASLATGVQDPHFIDPRPSFLVKLNRADLLIDGGLDLEVGWLPALLDSARNPRLHIGEPGRLDASQGIRVLGVPTGSVDRSQGDVHGKGNPHYLVDPMNGVIVADTIAKRLCRLDAAGCDVFTSNAQAFRTRIETGLSKWTKSLAPYRGAKIVVYHDSWPYFTKRFALNTVGYVEPKPGVPPPPSHVSALTDLMRREQAKIIMMEPYHERSIPDLLARQTGATVLVLAPTVGATPGTDDYVALFDTDVTRLVEALSAGGPAAK
ncbi:MAG TPA: metal ABC transporter substrate-binding protein [Nitrospiria bacterium]|nr:metal ABC transporter substrate-binding protein [Nitrospiria bacterium]